MKLLSADTIRRCVVADPGKLIITADFDQIELRVVAGLAGETKLIEAAKRGESLHKTAALQLFGEDHTPDQYKLSKNINFTFVFGGGPSTMAERYEISYEQAHQVMREYSDGFPKLAAYKRKEQEAVLKSALNPIEYKIYRGLKQRLFDYRSDTKAGRDARKAVQLEIKRLCRGKVGWVYNAFGRKLPVDAEKPYSVVNFKVQSTAADLMKQALLDIRRDDELWPTVLLPIHDEVLGQAPKRRAEYFAQRYAEVMTREFMGVPITAEGKVYGRSWGDGYAKND